MYENFIINLFMALAFIIILLVCIFIILLLIYSELKKQKEKFAEKNDPKGGEVK